MNPVPEPVEPPPNRQLVRAVLQSQKLRWVFPAVEGLPVDEVRELIRARLAETPYAGTLDDPTVTLTYPDGPYRAPFTRDQPPPLGWVGPWVLEPQPPPPVVPHPQNNTVPSEFGPLPEVNPREVEAQRAYSDLQGLLTQWASHHRVSSAEYFLHLTRALQFHAGQLVMRERRPR